MHQIVLGFLQGHILYIEEWFRGTKYLKISHMNKFFTVCLKKNANLVTLVAEMY